MSPARAAAVSAQNERAQHRKAQASRPSTYVDEVTRRRHPDVPVAAIHREDAPAKAAHDNNHRDAAAPDPASREQVREAAKGTRVRKHVHFAEDEGYASATGTPAPSPELHTAGCHIKLACAERREDDGKGAVGECGSARVLGDDPPRQQSARSVVSRKATSQPTTTKAKKRLRTENSVAPAVENIGCSYRNQYGNIVFEDFF